MSEDAQLRRSMSMDSMSFTEALGKAVNAVIRPPRASYQEDQISYIVFDMHLPPIPRIPLAFPNRRGERIVGSLYISGTFETEEIHRCIIYLHGNIGSQKEGRFIVPLYAPHGISVFCFDFSGSGNSGGKYVTLGKNEKTDVLDVITFLKEAMQFDEFVLWGRSMGAACAILSAAVLTNEIDAKMRKLAQSKRRYQSSPYLIQIPPKRSESCVITAKPLKQNQSENNIVSEQTTSESSQDPFNMTNHETDNQSNQQNNTHYTYQMAAIAGTFKMIEKEAAKAQEIAESIDQNTIRQHQELMKTNDVQNMPETSPLINQVSAPNTDSILIDQEPHTELNNEINQNNETNQMNENSEDHLNYDGIQAGHLETKHKDGSNNNESTEYLTHFHKRSPDKHLPTHEMRSSLPVNQQTSKKMQVPMLDIMPAPSLKPSSNSSRTPHLPPPIPIKSKEHNNQCSASTATIPTAPTLGTPSASVSSSESSMSISVPYMSVKGIIVDSAFSSLDDMLTAISEKCKLGAISNFVAQLWIKKSIQEQVGLRVDDVKPYESARACFRTPMLLGHSPEDDFIPFSQAEKIYKAYAGPKQLVILNGSHNAQRDENWIRECTHFISKCFDIPLEDLNQKISVQNPEHVASFFNLLKESPS